MRTLTVIALVLFGAGLRLAPHPENFVPIGALALFAGAKLDDQRLALLVPLGALALGDVLIGFHALIPAVYLAFALVVQIGARLPSEPGAASIALGGVAGSVVFFLITNTAVWLAFDTYPHTVEGLLRCYVFGLPHFARTLAAALFYSAVLFGGFAFLERRFPALARGAPLATGSPSWSARSPC